MFINIETIKAKTEHVNFADKNAFSQSSTLINLTFFSEVRFGESSCRREEEVKQIIQIHLLGLSGPHNTDFLVVQKSALDKEA